jgi:micrococcal nuclease
MPKRFSQNLFRIYWWVFFLAAFVLVRLAQEYWQPDHDHPLAEGTYRVARVIDGDTLLLESGQRLRLQGIDAPETVKPDYPVEPWGPEASAFAHQFVERAKGEVRLVFGIERIDAYGRQLAFVWHGDQMLNAELVRAGLARARLGYRYSGTMKRVLAEAEQEARDARRGIWSGEIIAGASADQN